MGGGSTVCIASMAIVFTCLLMWAVVPTEQTLDAKFPNVLYLSGMGAEGPLEPISFDNSSMPTISEAEAAALNGIYQFDPLFYHKSLDRFVPWENRGLTHIFECTFFCNPLNNTGEAVKLALVHTSPDEGKRWLWYLLEFHDGDANSPIVYARSKFRKAATYRSPFMTVTPGGELKPKDLKEVHLITAWDAFRFDTPLKWGCTAAIILATVALGRMSKDD
mmetsp:Transcript_31277/g.82891  ORF Transcript_31277/g.82891 Transcript_31277/m.82891 type:complete len:220 (-) Transcript_31277:91-750(-)